jgi:hypothetical protein
MSQAQTADTQRSSAKEIAARDRVTESPAKEVATDEHGSVLSGWLKTPYQRAEEKKEGPADERGLHARIHADQKKERERIGGDHLSFFPFYLFRF